DAASAIRTRRRDEKSLEQIWNLLTTGRTSGAVKHREEFRRQLEACDELLQRLPSDRSCWPQIVSEFVVRERIRIGGPQLIEARRVAGVLVEPIQGEGGLRFASASFFRRLRMFTRLYDVPLVFDEVQTGWGATGRMWAHELFDLPSPPDAVAWGKKAQNGVVFVSEELGAFFREERRFSTTWEGDSVGMLRLLSWLPRLDLEQVKRTGTLVQVGLERLAREYRGLLQRVRGVGALWAIDLVRPDWRDWLRDRAFRHGLILLPAGERTLRFFPRYDMEPYAIDEALELLRRALEDMLGGQSGSGYPHGPKLRVDWNERLPVSQVPRPPEDPQ
ncbi:aminotransferase class III-fold pyridoxal phosphate-dependent enzyme, partial [Myxococcota bacterium]